MPPDLTTTRWHPTNLSPILSVVQRALYTRAMANAQKRLFVQREQTEALLDQERAEAACHPRTAKSSQRPMI